MTTQLDASIGVAKETVYGTPVTVSKFVEYTEESIDWSPTFLQGQGLRSGSRTARAARRALGRQMVGGDFTVEAASKGIGWILEAAFGTVVSTQRAATGVYQHNFSPIANDYLSSYTVQKGVPILGNNSVAAHTFPGMVCSSLEFDLSNSDFLKLKPNWNGREVQTGVAYAAPSYPTPVELLTFVGGSIVIGGTVTAPTTTALATGTTVGDIRDFNMTWDNHLDDGGFNLSAGGKRARKPAVGIGEIKGKLTAEFDAVTLRDAYLGQTTLGLVLTVAGFGTIGTGTDVPAVSIYVPAIKLEGELPKTSSGGNVITQSIDFTGLDSLAASGPIVVSYVTTDTAP